MANRTRPPERSLESRITAIEEQVERIETKLAKLVASRPEPQRGQFTSRLDEAVGMHKALVLKSSGQ